MCAACWKGLVLVPIYKKNDQILCDNYLQRLLSVPGKVLSFILAC